MHRSIVFVAMALFLLSCNENVVTSDMESLPSVWNKSEPVVFTIPEQDSIKEYDVFLTVRNNNDYKFNNLFLITALDYPNGKTVTDTLEYRMANPDGSWLGNGIGSVKESKLWYKQGFTFREQGSYRLRISHALRNNGEVEGVTNLEGITDVGYSIEKQGQ